MILPNVHTHLCKYRNELHGNHVSVFESRRGDEVAFDEGLISLQFRLKDRAKTEDDFHAQRQKIENSASHNYKTSAAGSMISISTYGTEH